MFGSKRRLQQKEAEEAKKAEWEAEIARREEHERETAAAARREQILKLAQRRLHNRLEAYVWENWVAMVQEKRWLRNLIARATASHVQYAWLRWVDFILYQHQQVRAAQGFVLCVCLVSNVSTCVCVCCAGAPQAGRGALGAPHGDHRAQRHVAGVAHVARAPGGDLLGHERRARAAGVHRRAGQGGRQDTGARAAQARQEGLPGPAARAGRHRIARARSAPARFPSPAASSRRASGRPRAAWRCCSRGRPACPLGGTPPALACGSAKLG